MNSDAPDDELRRLYARARSQPESGAPHPDETAWERVFANDATRDERRRLMEHVVGCAQCAETYRALTVVRREASAFDPDVPAPMPAAAWSMRRVAYAAAAVLVLAVSVPLTLRLWRPEPARPPGAGPTSVAAPVQARALRDLPAFRLDKPAVILSAAAALTPRGVAQDRRAFLAALGPGLDAYRADDFAQAARLLDAVGQTYPAAVEPPLYAGISLLMLNRPAEAVSRLERAKSLASGEFAAEADWRLSLAYVHAGEPERARPGLQRLCATGNSYQPRACEALQALPPVR
jgi:hypothetical protein